MKKKIVSYTIDKELLERFDIVNSLVNDHRNKSQIVEDSIYDYVKKNTAEANEVYALRMKKINNKLK